MEKVTLVRIAADHSEAKRRREEEKIRTERCEEIHLEQLTFAEILSDSILQCHL